MLTYAGRTVLKTWLQSCLFFTLTSQAIETLASPHWSEPHDLFLPKYHVNPEAVRKFGWERLSETIDTIEGYTNFIKVPSVEVDLGRVKAKRLSKLSESLAGEAHHPVHKLWHTPAGPNGYGVRFQYQFDVETE